MRHIRFLRLAILVAALSACVGASECSGSGGGGGGKASADSGTGVIDPPGGGDDPVTPTPEPSGALIFGLGTLIAAAATRRRSATRG